MAIEEIAQGVPNSGSSHILCVAYGCGGISAIILQTQVRANETVVLYIQNPLKHAHKNFTLHSQCALSMYDPNT